MVPNWDLSPDARVANKADFGMFERDNPWDTEFPVAADAPVIEGQWRELPPEEEAYCQENNWRCVITFKSVDKFEKPFPIKESILSDDPRKGMFLHGARFTEEQIDSILEAAEDYQG